MRKKSPSPRRFLAQAATLLAVGTGLAAVYSCSLIVETRSQQCQSNSDCAAFPSYPICNTGMGICVSSTTTTNSSSGTGGSSSGTTSSGGCNVDGGIDGGGCYNGGVGSCPAADNNSEYLNQCTTGCFPFDDSTVMGLVNGKRPSLPRPPDGGM